jgi:hypothetical protein
MELLVILSFGRKKLPKRVIWRELLNARIDTDGKIVYLNGLSPFKLNYLAPTYVSFIYPYHITGDNYKKYYCVSIFSQDYFYIRKKIQELKKLK